MLLLAHESGLLALQSGLLALQSGLLAPTLGLQIRYLIVEFDDLPGTDRQHCDNDDASPLYAAMPVRIKRAQLQLDIERPEIAEER